MTHKQVYLYGALDPGPTLLNRNCGMAWGIGGWLVFPYLQRTGTDTVQKLKIRVAAEIKTTFASQYTGEISFAEALRPDVLAAYSRRATGQKFLLNPNKGV